MAEERITERTDSSGNVTERVVERGSDTTVVERRGGGSGILIAVVLLIAVAVLAYFLSDMNRKEAAQTDAISGAAADVSDGAKKVGAAAEKAAEDLTGDK